MLYPCTTLNCRGRLLSLQQPKVMGILNLTPDSFYDGGKFRATDAALRQSERMLREGAAIIDIGGMSSRPGAKLLSPDEELSRVLPVVQSLVLQFPEAFFSIDTVYSQTAKETVESGVHIVNDISAGKIDPDLFTTVARLGVPYVLMHMQGKPQDMQHQPDYENVLLEILDFFIDKVGQLRALGCKDI